MGTHLVGGATPVSVAEGGTNAITAGAALTSLGAAGVTTTQTLTNKKLDDSTTTISNTADPTKLVKVSASGLTTMTTRTLTVQDVNGTVYVSGGTKIPITDGGTGQGTAENARGALGSVGILSTTTGIDGKTVAATTLYTVPMGKTAIITQAIVRLTTATLITVTGTAGIGANVTQDDIFSSVPLTGLTTTGLVYSYLNPGATYVSVAAAGVIQIGIDVGYTGTTATLSVDLIGYLV